MSRVIHFDLEQAAEYFEGLEDPRSAVNLKHPFVSVLMIAMMGVLAGADGPTAIVRWARLKADFLQETLPLPNGIPGKDVFWRVLAALKPAAFQACFYAWLNSLRTAAEEEQEVEQPVLAIDGKTSRRSHNRSKGLAALHAVSVWASEAELTLAQVPCAAHSNEITAIPEVLKLIDAKGAIITIDAMGTQTAIAEQIIDQEADYVLALKANHPHLHAAVVAHVETQMKTNFEDVAAEQHATQETSHGREETRLYVQMPVPADLPGKENWKGLKTIGVAIRTSIEKGKETTAARYFLSSLPIAAKRFAHAVRTHWSIETTCHWSLDFTFREDESRIAHVHLRENFAWLKRFSLSLLKQHPAKLSTVMKRRSCAWSDTFLMETLTGKTT